MGTSKKSTQEFIDESFAEVDAMNLEALQKNEDLQKIIAATSAAENKITINGVDIRFKAFLDRRLRHKIARYQKLKEDDIVGIEDALYTILTSLCINPPFNTKDSWIFIEDNGGDVNGILRQILEVISGDTAAVKNFRGKS
jgi:hypothetical protein